MVARRAHLIGPLGRVAVEVDKCFFGAQDRAAQPPRVGHQHALEPEQQRQRQAQLGRIRLQPDCPTYEQLPRDVREIERYGKAIEERGG